MNQAFVCLNSLKACTVNDFLYEWVNFVENAYRACVSATIFFLMDVTSMVVGIKSFCYKKYPKNFQRISSDNPNKNPLLHTLKMHWNCATSQICKLAVQICARNINHYQFGESRWHCCSLYRNHTIVLPTNWFELKQVIFKYYLQKLIEFPRTKQSIIIRIFLKYSVYCRNVFVVFVHLSRITNNIAIMNLICNYELIAKYDKNLNEKVIEAFFYFPNYLNYYKRDDEWTWIFYKKI